MEKQPFVILDVETTGLRIPDARVIKVSLLKYHADGSIEKMTELVNPGVPVPEEVTAINGISDSDLVGIDNFIKKADKFNDFIDGLPLVGYAIKSFDLPMFVQEFYLVNKKLDKSGGVIDLQEIFLRKEPRTLAGAYRFYTGQVKGKLNDVDAMLGIFEGQLGKYTMPAKMSNLVAEYADDSILDLANKFRKDPNTGQIYFMFGKFNAKTLQYVEENDPSYITWILGSSLFPEDTKEVLRKYSSVTE